MLVVPPQRAVPMVTGPRCSQPPYFATMSLIPMDEPAAMGRAFELAWRGWGRVAPNPLVGAVVLAGGRAVGEGWHAEYGGRHAETAALAEAGAAARGATLVVTLEPCAHQGLQPPCTEAVIAAGVRRVVMATLDPNPAAGGGAERLRAAGIETSIGLLGDVAAAQNRRFLHRFREAGRPFVALKLATSLDGKIADRDGRSRWISGAGARDYVHWLRAGFAAIAVGGDTARADDPSLTIRGSVVPRVPPIRVIFDRRLDLPRQLTVVRTAGEVPTTVVTALPADPGRRRALCAQGVAVVEASDLSEGLQALRHDGVDALLVEGGGRLAGGLLSAGLVDRYYWIQSPLWLGDAGVPATAGLIAPSLTDAEHWRVVERRALQEDTLLVLDRR